MEQQKLIRIALPGLITAVFVIALWPVLQKLSIRWEGGDNNYRYLVVLLFIYLLWDKRDRGSRFRGQGSRFGRGIFKGEDEKFDS